MRKSSLFLSLLAAVTLIGFSFTTPVEDVAVDLESSVIYWVGKKVTGQHNGTVKLKSGSLTMEEGVLTGGEFEIDMTTITVDDLKGGGADKLRGHLSSDDFFGVNNYPTASFKMTKVVPYGTAGDYKVVGDLTIKESTNQVKFMAKVGEEEGKKVAMADIVVDRSDYDVRYGSGSFFSNLGDKAISDNFELQVKLVMK